MADAYKIHYGDPVHHGGPSQSMAACILHITRADESGRLYMATPQGIRRLKTAYDYSLLNSLIDRMRVLP